jgi:hypothetical protein
MVEVTWNVTKTRIRGANGGYRGASVCKVLTQMLRAVGAHYGFSLEFGLAFAAGCRIDVTKSDPTQR